MNIDLLDRIKVLNPWLSEPNHPFYYKNQYVERMASDQLLSSEWDDLCLVLLGPRQAGKTTLGLHLCDALVKQGSWKTLLYLNCDYFEIREWLTGPKVIQELLAELKLSKPIVFIDEVQRLENPGLLLKTIIDLHLPIKLMASGSSRLELKSKVQEFLTGREFESLILPFSFREAQGNASIRDLLIYGCYPKIVLSHEKALRLRQLYEDYIQKDIVTILQISKPDVFQRLVSLVAHSSGQLVNYEQLAVDCRVSTTIIRHYLDVLENTYVTRKLLPFVGNKRTELTSNPILYFIDNGFRNTALSNFNDIDQRTDAGLLAEGVVFQEILKHKEQRHRDFTISYWRTKGGAEVDFILHQNNQHAIPVEVKYRNMKKAMIPRGYRSFIQAYHPKIGIMITKNYIDQVEIEGCVVHFIPLEQLDKLIALLEEAMNTP